MNEESTLYEERPIESLEVFTGDEVKLLAETYKIKTLGALLNATRGLTNIVFFQTLDNSDEKLEKLRCLVPQEIISRYTLIDTSKQMGLLVEEDDEEGGENDEEQ